MAALSGLMCNAIFYAYLDIRVVTVMAVGEVTVAPSTSGVQDGNSSDWQFVWERYLNTSAPTEKKYLLLALGASKDPLILEKYGLRAARLTETA